MAVDARGDSQLSSRSIMLVLSRTAWAKNSLLIAVVDEMFSFVKIAGKLYKSCMCLILSKIYYYIKKLTILSV